MTSFDFSTFHSAGEAICLSNDTVLVLADPAKWIIIWRQTSSPVTAPESEFDVRMILLTMRFGSPEVAWSRVYLREKSALSRVDFFCSNFFFECGGFSDNVTNLCSDILNFDLYFLLEFLFWSASFLTWSSFFLLISSMVSDRTPMNMTSAWMTSFEDAAAVSNGMNSWLSVTAKNAMTSSDYTMNDGLTPSNDVGWGTLGLRRWSWANILTSAPSLRWRSHLNLLSFPDDDDDDDVIVVSVSVFDVIILLSSCVQHITTMSKWPMRMTRTWKWPEQDLERDFSDLNCLNISAWGAYDTTTDEEDDMMKISEWPLQLHLFYDLSQWGTYHRAEFWQ